MDGLKFRDARPGDLAAVLFLLADGFLSGDGVADPVAETPDPEDPRHARALAEIGADPNNRLIVVERAGEVVGTFHLTVIPAVSLKASHRLQIEGVRVRADLRGMGIGRAVMAWVERYARERACALIQLTTDRDRDGRAKRFYESLGFAASHHGMKRRLD